MKAKYLLFPDVREDLNVRISLSKFTVLNSDISHLLEIHAQSFLLFIIKMQL